MVAHQVFLCILRTTEVLLHILVVLRIAKILPVFIFFPQHLAEIGKRFINGKIAPAFGSYIIAKPMMEKLMRYRAFPAIAVEQFS